MPSVLMVAYHFEVVFRVNHRTTAHLETNPYGHEFQKGTASVVGGHESPK